MVGGKILFGKPGVLWVADAALQMLQKNQLLKPLTDGGKNILLHLAGGVMTEPGMDMAVALGVDQHRFAGKTKG